MNACSDSPATERPAKSCETCGAAIPRRGYSADRYERLARFCSRRCRTSAKPRLVGCAKCGRLLKRAYRTANPTCRPDCGRETATRSRRPAFSLSAQMPDLPPVTPKFAEEFQPLVYRLFLPLLGAELNWTIFTAEGQAKLERALTLPVLHPDSIGEAVVLSKRPLAQPSVAA